MAVRISYMPISIKYKEQLIMCNVLPAALYGVESTHVNKQALGQLRSAVATAIGNKSAKRSVDLTFACSECAKDLDPNAHILYNRVAGIRRLLFNHNKMGMVKSLIRKHNSYTATKTKSSPKHDIWPAATKEDDEMEQHDFGPVGLLISDLEKLGCKLNENVVIEQKNDVNIDILNMPWQHLKTAVMHIQTSSRIKTVDECRTFCGHLHEIDETVITRSKDHN